MSSRGPTLQSRRATLLIEQSSLSSEIQGLAPYRIFADPAGIEVLAVIASKLTRLGYTQRRDARRGHGCDGAVSFRLNGFNGVIISHIDQRTDSTIKCEIDAFPSVGWKRLIGKKFQSNDFQKWEGFCSSLENCLKERDPSAKMDKYGGRTS